MPPPEQEWLTRKKRIDPQLDAVGWTRLVAQQNRVAGRTEEEETANGPADYALWFDNQIAGVVEAKRLTVGRQNVLTRAERYAPGLPQVGWNFYGLRCPFLYSTNGEVIWFHDVRHPLNRSREIARFHSVAALREQLTRDFDGVSPDYLVQL